MGRYPTVGEQEQAYREFQALKKQNPDAANGMVLFNQKVLTAAGRIHAMCLKPGSRYEFSEKGKAAYHAFVNETFVGMLYADWRRARAVSIAKRLNVQLTIEDCVGETFYAGIPLCSPEEVAKAEDMCEEYVFEAVSEKIGIDGKYHPVDKYGDFKDYPWDQDDIYGDGTGVTDAELKAVVAVKHRQ
jgi:hypothetical protein